MYTTVIKINGRVGRGHAKFLIIFGNDIASDGIALLEYVMLELCK